MIASARPRMQVPVLQTTNLHCRKSHALQNHHCRIRESRIADCLVACDAWKNGETSCRHARPASMKRIFAMGGGGFMTEEGPSLLDDYLVALAGVTVPKICFIPTASGDAEKHLDKFYLDFARFRAELSHLAFFRKARPGAIAFDRIEERICEQDIVYVGGGNTRSMLAVWREWGVPNALRSALARGTILAGASAGAICWFEWGASDSLAPGGRSGPLRCLGFLKGSCSPHWGGEVHRRRDYHAMIRRGDVPAGYGVSDGAALVFHDGRLAEVVGSTPQAGAFRVELVRDRLVETPLPLKSLVRASPPSTRRTTR